MRFLFNRSGFGCAADSAGSCFLALCGAGGFGGNSPVGISMLTIIELIGITISAVFAGIDYLALVLTCCFKGF